MLSTWKNKFVLMNINQIDFNFGPWLIMKDIFSIDQLYLGYICLLSHENPKMIGLDDVEHDFWNKLQVYSCIPLKVEFYGSYH
jgi:hypothetical protein